MIKIYDRKKDSYEIEKVAGSKYIKWCYELQELITKQKL